jgi:hypothetical protein
MTWRKAGIEKLGDLPSAIFRGFPRQITSDRLEAHEHYDLTARADKGKLSLRIVPRRVCAMRAMT